VEGPRTARSPGPARTSAVSTSRAVGSVGLSEFNTTAEPWPRVNMASIASRRQSPKFGRQALIRPISGPSVRLKKPSGPRGPNAMYPVVSACCARATRFAARSCRNAVLNEPASSTRSGGTSRVLVRPGFDAFAITAMPQPEAPPFARFRSATWSSPLNLCRKLLADVLCRHSQSPPGQGDTDDFIVGNGSTAALDPGGSRRVLLWIHVEGRELTAEDCHHLDRRSHQPFAPSKPTAVRDEQQDPAFRCAHHLADEANRHVPVVEHAQADQVTNADRLREAPVHSFLRRYRILLW